MKKLLLFLLPVIVFVGCTKIDYIGEEYYPTDYVDVYFDEAEIPREYKIMGKLIASGDDWVSSEKMLKKIREKAMSKGADGVIITGMEKYISGEKTTYKETTEEDKDKITTTAVTETNTEETKQITATLIKYQ